MNGPHFGHYLRPIPLYQPGPEPRRRVPWLLILSLAIALGFFVAGAFPAHGLALLDAIRQAMQ